MSKPETYTFRLSNVGATVTVKYSWYERFGHAIDEPAYTLNKQYSLATYLHNPYGPAIVYDTGHMEYFINGKHLSVADAEKIIQKVGFDKELNAILNED